MRTATVINAVNEPFFTGDGSSSAGQLQYGGTPMVDASNILISRITQTGWDGVQTLYTLPRTNSVKNSANLAGATGTNVTLSAGTGPCPDGSNSYGIITSTASAAPQLAAAVINNTLYPDPSGYYTFRACVQDISSRYVCFQVNQLNASNGVVAASAINFDMTAGVFGSEFQVSVALNKFVNVSATLVNGWWLITFQCVASALGTTHIQSYIGQASSLSSRGGTTGAALAFFGVQDCSGTYLPTTTTVVTRTDYSYTEDNVSFGYVPASGATASASFTATAQVLDIAPTILAQYANSPTLLQLLYDFNETLDPAVNIDALYDMVWNLNTAQGIGLDIWGRIVNVPRTITIVPPTKFFGFDEAAPTSFAFNDQPYYTGPQQGTQYTLTDAAYKVLILTKALANISSFTAQSVNKLLNYMFNGQGTTRGSCYVLELSPMQVEYVFNFALQPWEASVLEQPALMPRPAGVGVSIIVNG